jgi:hypothetical protein
MNLFVRLLFYIFTLLMCFFGGPFFLLPWYSISGPYRQYKDYETSLTDLIRICRGSPLPSSSNMLFLSITTIPNLYNKNISIAALLWTHVISSENRTCPEGFQYVESGKHWTNELDTNATLFREERELYCLQWRLEETYFLPFTPSEWEEETDYYGPRGGSQYVVHMNFNLKDIPKDFPVYMQAFVLDFGIPESEDIDNYPTVRSQSCNFNDSYSVCQTFFKAMLNETKAFHPNEEGPWIDLIYKTNQGFCIDDYQCAGIIKLSNERCHGYFNPNRGDPECQFILEYMVFSALPNVYAATHVWTYNVIAFVTCLAVWLFAAFYMTIYLHHNYLLNYYMKPPIKKLEANTQYDIQLTIYGEPFSKFSCLFEIRDQTNDRIIFQTPITIEFDSEEYEGSYQAIVNKEFTFSVNEESSNEIQFSCYWEGEFQQADFDAPNIQVIMRKHIIPVIKNWSNAFGFAPLLCLFHIITKIPDRKLFVRFEVFVFLSIFVLSVTSTWFFVTVFIILMNINLFRSFVFSSAVYRTKVPIIFYAVFLASVLTPAIITIIKPRRFATKFFSIDNTVTTRESKAFMISQYHSSVAASVPKVRHTDVEYVSLDTITTIGTGQVIKIPPTVQRTRELNPLSTPSSFFQDE